MALSDTVKLGVCNAALEHLGQEPAVDLSAGSQAASVALVKLLRVVDAARDAVLGRHGWLCALTYDTWNLQPATGGYAAYVNFRYPGLYIPPTNFLRLWEVEGFTDQDWCGRWEVGTWSPDVTATDSVPVLRAIEAADSLDVVYVGRVDWTALDVGLRDAMGYELAARAAFSITGEKDLAEEMRKEADQRIELAISVEATQAGGQPPLTYSTPAVLRARAR